ncbi:uncharacterized [Tachysurus ichikawai]
MRDFPTALNCTLHNAALEMDKRKGRKVRNAMQLQWNPAIGFPFTVTKSMTLSYQQDTVVTAHGESENSIQVSISRCGSSTES